MSVESAIGLEAMVGEIFSQLAFVTNPSTLGVCMKNEPDKQVLELAAAKLYVGGCSHKIIKQRIGVGSETAVKRLLDQGKGRLWDNTRALIENNIDAIDPRIVAATD